MTTGHEGHDEIMTVEQVARYLKLKPQTVYKWAQEGQIPGAKLGKEWRFRRRIVDQWIDNSILLSRGGFNHLVQQTQLGMQQSGVRGEDIERLIKEFGA
jgi:excisionase family DNA binding protein